MIILMLFLISDSPQKLKLEKVPGTLAILSYVRLSSPQLQWLFLFYWKQKKQPLISK